MRRKRRKKSKIKGMISLLGIFGFGKSKSGKASMWQMNAGTNHGGRKKHKGILGF